MCADKNYYLGSPQQRLLMKLKQKKNRKYSEISQYIENSKGHFNVITFII